MTVEGGLMTGIVAPCTPIIEFLKQRRGLDVATQLIYPDADANYAKVLTVHLDDVPLTVATPEILEIEPRWPHIQLSPFTT